MFEARDEADRQFAQAQQAGAVVVVGDEGEADLGHAEHVFDVGKDVAGEVGLHGSVGEDLREEVLAAVEVSCHSGMSGFCRHREAT